MATETYVNDNDGTGEVGENALPNNINTVGNIGVNSTVTQVDLVEVNLRTGLVSTVGGGLAGSEGAILNTGTITYDYDATVAVPTNTARLDVEGANNINIAAVNTADAEITALTVDSTGFTAALTAPGTSPAFQLDNTELLTFTNSNVGNTSTIAITADAVDSGDETLTVNYLLNGVAGSVIMNNFAVDATNAGALATAVAIGIGQCGGHFGTSTSRQRGNRQW